MLLRFNSEKINRTKRIAQNTEPFLNTTEYKIIPA